MNGATRWPLATEDQVPDTAIAALARLLLSLPVPPATQTDSAKLRLHDGDAKGRHPSSYSTKTKRCD